MRKRSSPSPSSSNASPPTGRPLSVRAPSHSPAVEDPLSLRKPHSTPETCPPATSPSPLASALLAPARHSLASFHSALSTATSTTDWCSCASSASPESVRSLASTSTASAAAHSGSTPFPRISTDPATLATATAGILTKPTGSTRENVQPAAKGTHSASKHGSPTSPGFLSSPSPTTLTSPFSPTSTAMLKFKEKYDGGVDDGAITLEEISSRSKRGLSQRKDAKLGNVLQLAADHDIEKGERAFHLPAHRETLDSRKHRRYHQNWKSGEPLILYALTRSIVTTYQSCNPDYKYSPAVNPRRVLTKPSEGVHNDGHDNRDHDYILFVGDILGDKEGQKYRILEILGQGTFGQVVKCQHLKTKEMVAVKVIKNKPAYFNQSMMEVTILELLNNRFDRNDKHNILRMKDTFIFRKHLCLVFEVLSLNLYELVKQNQFRGLSLNLVRMFTTQILDALCVLSEAKIIHCDLKPENILLKKYQNVTANQTVYTYIQSRFYRSPEVLLGMPYSSSIDIWSVGCIAAELFLGLPLFPGSSEYNQLCRIIEMLGMPPSHMMGFGKNTSLFFNQTRGENGKPLWTLKSLEQYAAERNLVESPSKRYFSARTLPELIRSYPLPGSASTPENADRELLHRDMFIDFISGLLKLNPLERWSPYQAKLHPFISGVPWKGPFTPQMVLRVPPGGMAPPRRTRATTMGSTNVSAIPVQIQRAAAVTSSTDSVNSQESYLQHQGKPSSVQEKRGEYEQVVVDVQDLNIEDKSAHRQQQPSRKQSLASSSEDFEMGAAKLRQARSYSVTDQLVPASWLKVLASQKSSSTGEHQRDRGDRGNFGLIPAARTSESLSTGDLDGSTGYPPGFRDLRRPSYGQLPSRFATSMSSLSNIKEHTSPEEHSSSMPPSNRPPEKPANRTGGSLHDQLQQHRMQKYTGSLESGPNSGASSNAILAAGPYRRRMSEPGNTPPVARKPTGPMLDISPRSQPRMDVLEDGEPLDYSSSTQMHHFRPPPSVDNVALSTVSLPIQPGTTSAMHSPRTNHQRHISAGPSLAVQIPPVHPSAGGFSQSSFPMSAPVYASHMAGYYFPAYGGHPRQQLPPPPGMFGGAPMSAYQGYPAYAGAAMAPPTYMPGSGPQWTTPTTAPPMVPMHMHASVPPSPQAPRTGGGPREAPSISKVDSDDAEDATGKAAER